MTQFEDTIRSTCSELAEILIQKNAKYGDSYRKSRIEAGKTWENRKLPFDFHANEKIMRYRNCDDEDCVLDLAGYSILELVCRRLDDGSD
jgi:hypothetical protein